MNVQARYSVDRKIYTAKIDSLTPFGAKVTFTDYGNEEEVGASREFFVCVTTLVYVCPYSNATLHWLCICRCHFNGLNFSQKSPRRGRYACPLCVSVGFGVEIVSSPSVGNPTEQSIMNHPCAVCCGGRAVAGDSRTPKNCFYRFVKRFQHLPFSFASLSQLFDVLAYTYADAHRIAQNAHVHK